MPLTINPPLLNSANPWATDLSHLRPLYASPYTGAITTRTSLLAGFPHDDAVNQYTFFDPSRQSPASDKASPAPADSASLNTLGYSPIPLHGYLSMIATLSAEARRSNGLLRTDKPILVSVTGSVDEVVECYRQINAAQARVCMPLAMEINLSCPNIPTKPPPAYSRDRLAEYLAALAPLVDTAVGGVPIGIKTPPYTYAAQFGMLVSALMAVAPCPVSFITATNTLAPALLLAPPPLPPATAESADYEPVLGSTSGLGLGGMAGAPLHALALGNVLSITEALKAEPTLKGVLVIGVGGVDDAEGWRRMRRVGAGAVGVGTALGRMGVDVFGRIWKGVEGAKL